jgi:GalNAc-alpha-(1->4)-GalNAc-alpha-(1->3)-diNAcBac-PP-undecaprenol alpha-1,4-N-acetyl-D-galactosaminyltransferase
MKLTLVTPSLSCGGAERVAVSLTQGFIEKGYDITVITVANQESDFYQLPEGATRLELNANRSSLTVLDSIGNTVNRIWKLRQAICSTHPDAVISFLIKTNILTLLSLLGTNYPVIVTEHSDLSAAPSRQIVKKLQKIVYPYAKKVVSVSHGVDRYFDWLESSKRSVIYNPFVISSTSESIAYPPDLNPQKPWIASMGRLTYGKGFDLLLKAFSKLHHQYPDWQLLILGEGEFREPLEALRDELGLTSCVFLPGKINNPFGLLKHAKFFVMASRFEGFPMVHGEAMACGLPVISTDCPSGPNELIRHNIDGLLVENEDISALASAIEHLMSDENDRQRLAARTVEVLERFNLQKAIQNWQDLLDSLFN